ETIEMGRFYSLQVPTWNALESYIVPVLPIQLVFNPDDDKVFTYEVTRHRKKSARPYGAFRKDPDPTKKLVLDIVDPDTKKRRKVRLCPVCKKPYDHMRVVHRLWGQTCEECPSVVLLRGETSYDRTRGLFVNHGA